MRTLGRDLCRNQRRKRGEKKRAQKDLHTALDPALARMSLYSFPEGWSVGPAVRTFLFSAGTTAAKSRMEMRRPVTLLRRDRIFRLGLRAIESGLSLVQIVTPCDPGEKKKCRQSHDARHREEPCPAHLL